MYELKKWEGIYEQICCTGPSSYEMTIYRAAVLQRLRNTAPDCRMCTTTLGRCFRLVVGIRNEANLKLCSRKRLDLGRMLWDTQKQTRVRIYSVAAGRLEFQAT